MLVVLRLHLWIEIKKLSSTLSRKSQNFGLNFLIGTHVAFLVWFEIKPGGMGGFGSGRQGSVNLNLGEKREGRGGGLPSISCPGNIKPLLQE